MELSIIVPVYNVEKYVRPCIESILRQGLDEARYEVIIVNDGSTDQSMNVISDLVEGHSNMNVINQSNQGLSVARNKGLEKAQGSYILFLDSDDLLLDYTLAALLEETMKEQPDMLTANFVKMNDQEIEQHLPQSSHCTFRATTGTEYFLHDLNPRECFVWHTLYKRDFLNKNQLRFIPGIYFEDVPFTVACYLNAERCIVASHTLYIYRQRTGSIVSSLNKKKMMDIHVVLAALWNMRPQVTDKERRQKLMETIFTTFSIEMWYITHHQHLFAERKTIIHNLKKTVPDLYFDHGLKERVVSFLYKHLPFTYLWLRTSGNKGLN